MSSPLNILIAGSTKYTVLCANSLSSDPRFIIQGVLTPRPKLMGRKQEITPNPLHVFANTHTLPVTLIDEKIDQEIQTKISKTFSKNIPDILLVVDFGYLIPSWLLAYPRLGAVNIHPSNLPKFRGSSPGQFALIYGETDSAVSIIRMDEKMDHGGILFKLPFTISRDWTSSQYYDFAFASVSEKLPDFLVAFSKNPSSLTSQPDTSPTPVARRLKREDGFIPEVSLQLLLAQKKLTSPLPFHAQYQIQTTPQTFFDLWRGLTPWPGLWTLGKSGATQNLRVKLLEFSFQGSQLRLTKYQVEGKRERTGNYLAI